MQVSLTLCCPLACCVAEGAPTTAEPSLAGLPAGPSTAVLPGDGGTGGTFAEGQVTITTFRQLLDRLLQQKADMEGLLPASAINIIRLNAAGLKQALLPWPLKRLAELQQALPVLAAGASYLVNCPLHAQLHACLQAALRPSVSTVQACFLPLQA